MGSLYRAHERGRDVGGQHGVAGGEFDMHGRGVIANKHSIDFESRKRVRASVRALTLKVVMFWSQVECYFSTDRTRSSLMQWSSLQPSRASTSCRTCLKLNLS